MTIHKVIDDSSPRIKRTPPERSGPIRSPMASRSQGHVESGFQSDPISAAGATVRGVLESGVRTAYAVIDEYLRRGQNAARATYNEFYKRGPMNEDRPNFGGGYNNPWGGGYNNPVNPLSMILEQYMMALRMWSQAVSSVVPCGFPQPGMYPAPFSEPAMPLITIKVSSASPVEVELNLYPGLDQGRLVCEDLRAEDGSVKFSEPASLVREGGGVRATVKVGAAQPKGRYRALVRRETDRNIVGELVVTV